MYLALSQAHVVDHRFWEDSLSGPPLWNIYGPNIKAELRSWEWPAWWRQGTTADGFQWCHLRLHQTYNLWCLMEQLCTGVVCGMRSSTSSYCGYSSLSVCSLISPVAIALPEKDIFSCLRQNQIRFWQGNDYLVPQRCNGFLLWTKIGIV